LFQNAGPASNNREDSPLIPDGKGEQHGRGYPNFCNKDDDSVTKAIAMYDPMTLQTPRWLNTLVATIAEAVLLVVTIGIITAMWLPAYLSSRGQTATEHSQDDMVGLFPRGR
jgi:hypothetical protein